jgi:hypothetical protein
LGCSESALSTKRAGVDNGFPMPELFCGVALKKGSSKHGISLIKRPKPVRVLKRWSASLYQP